jgi:hypothetical protein
MKIDRNGDAFMRFDEGSPTISTFGGLIAESPESSRQYVYTAGSGTLSYVSGERSILLDTNFTASGDLVTRQSHLYHPYQPGTTTKVLQTMVVGDAGKANVRRRWGYFDENNGAFWELDGTTLYVVIRSDTTGSVVDTRVAQADWNSDQLDGTTDFVLDVTKANIYWIDLQWLGVGIVKFGIYEQDGRKTACHVFQNPNNNSAAYMRSATLPIRFECENTDTAVSSSELKNICSVVQLVGTIKRQFNSFGFTCTQSTSIGPSDGETPVFALKPKASINGIVNHGLIIPKEVTVYSDADSSGLFNIRLKGLSFTTGGTFNSVAGNDNFSEEFENFTPYSQYSILTTVLSDQVTRPEITVTVEPITATSTGNFYVAMNFDEMVY